MNLRHLLLGAAVTFAACTPALALAQQAPDSPVPYASAQPPDAMHRAGEPPHRGMMMLLRGVDLTPQQQAQIKTLADAFHQAHPKGSPPDPAARKQLHDQIMALLTPAQQAQVKANMAQMRDRMPPGGPGAPDGPAAPMPSPSPNSTGR